MIANGISPSDIPCADLKLLKLTLENRIATDSDMLLEINLELIRRAPNVAISSTVRGKIQPRAQMAE